MNKFVPIGLTYVHQFVYNEPGYNLPTVVGAANKSATPIYPAIIYSNGYTIQVASHLSEEIHPSTTYGRSGVMAVSPHTTDFSHFGFEPEVRFSMSTG